MELEDIINNWNICLRIIVTLIKENKNKIIELQIELQLHDSRNPKNQLIEHNVGVKIGE